MVVFVANVWRRARAAQGRPRRQRPLARRHARVVHDLAAATAELRQRPVRDERAAVARPAAAARGGRRRDGDRARTGSRLAARCRRSSRQAGRCSRSSPAPRASARRTGCSRRSWLRRSPRSSCRPGTRTGGSSRRRSSPPRCSRGAAAVPAPHAHSGLAAFALAALVVVVRAELPRRARAAARLVARLRGADEAADHVAPAHHRLLRDDRRARAAGPERDSRSPRWSGSPSPAAARRALNHVLDRDIDPLMGEAHELPAGRVGARRRRAARSSSGSRCWRSPSCCSRAR